MSLRPVQHRVVNPDPDATPCGPRPPGLGPPIDDQGVPVAHERLPDDGHPRLGERAIPHPV